MPRIEKATSLEAMKAISDLQIPAPGGAKPCLSVAKDGRHYTVITDSPPLGKGFFQRIFNSQPKPSVDDLRDLKKLY